MRKIILSLIAIIIVMTGCEKYNLNRIYGYYNLTSYQVNGEDSLSLYKDSLGVNFQFYYSDQSERNACTIDGIRNDGNETSLIWQWKFDNDNKILQVITSYGQKGTGPIGGSKTPEWEILKLKSNFLQFKTIFNNKEYIIELKEKY